MKKSIKIGGISTKSVYEDGCLYDKVNMRYKNGANIPVCQRRIETELSREYDLIIIHKNSDYENWIGVRSSFETNSSIYYNIKESPVRLATVTGTINSVEQIGNTLSFITQDNIYYALFSDNSYNFLGSLPELPAIAFSVGEEAYITESFSDLNGMYYASEEAVVFLKGKLLELKNTLRTWNSFTDIHLVRWAFRLYDGSYVKASNPILISPVNITEYGKADVWKPFKVQVNKGGIRFSQNFDETAYAKASCYRVNMEFDFDTEELLGFKDIIKSIDLFISLPIGFSTVESFFSGNYSLVSLDGTREGPSGFWASETIKESIRSIESQSLFYLLRSFPIGEAWKGGVYPVGTGGRTSPWGDNIDTKHMIPSSYEDYLSMQNIETEERLTDDASSHHRYGAKHSFSYNGRLNIADISTTLFKGFTLPFFNLGETGLSNSGWESSFIVEVEVLIDGELKVVRNRYDFGTGRALCLQPYLSYPDARAKRMTIYGEVSRNVSWKKYLSVALTPHDSLDLAYYTTGLSPIFKKTEEEIAYPNGAFDDVVGREQNKIKVSEVNNPMVFSAINTYVVGDLVFGLQASVMNASDRNFGQYPMYVATNRGFFMLGIGQGEIVYSQIIPVASTEIPVSELLCPTPYGIAFVGRRGIFIINGHETVCITLEVEEYPVGISLNETEVRDVFPFLDYIKGVDNLIYNPHDNELLIINKDYTFNYVYDFDDKMLYKSTERVDSEIRNSYPQLLVKDGRRIKDYSSSDIKKAQISMITRPVYFGVDEVKRLQRAIIRGEFWGLKTSTTTPFLILYGSNDGIHYKLLRSFTLPANRQGLSYKDFDLGLLARATFRSYLIEFRAEIEEKSVIRQIDFEVSDRYGNDKMR